MNMVFSIDDQTRTMIERGYTAYQAVHLGVQLGVLMYIESHYMMKDINKNHSQHIPYALRVYK